MAYDDLVGILNCVRVETEGHMAIGDTEAARRSLKEFATFIETEQLNDRDTILKIDSRLPSAQKRPEVVDEFYAIAQRAMHLSALTAGESVPKLRLTHGCQVRRNVLRWSTNSMQSPSVRCISAH